MATPFTYLIRMERTRYLVLSESVMLVVVIPMTYGKLILHLLNTFKNTVRSMVNPML